MAKKIIDSTTSTKYLTAQQIKELALVVKDIFFFATFIFVIHPTRSKVAFDLYPYQRSVIYQFLKHRFNIILKFRQAGITELISMYCLWLAMYHPNKKIQIISIKDQVAKKVLKKIKFMYKNLPDHLRTPIVNGRTGEFGTSSMIEFSNGSFIESLPASEDAGRGESLSLLIIDEAAIVRWASTIWAAAFPTLSTGGSAIINSCITGDTEIVGRHGNFRVEQVCPKEFGAQDIRFMNIEVLTHNLQWKKAIYGLNKGILETWEIENDQGDIIKCTPAHKFLTPQGWKSARDIVEKGLYTLRYDSQSGLEEAPTTTPPTIEIRKDIRGYPNYQVSNLGKIYFKTSGKEKVSKPNSLGYHRIKLWAKNKSKSIQVSRLVAEAFIGKIPKGYVVDHINCKSHDNYVTNLQIITREENAQRATRFSRGLILNLNTGKGSPDLQLVSYIKYLSDVKGNKPDLIISKVKRRFDKDITRVYISRIVNHKRNKNLCLTKLRVNRKYSENIYDITVEGDESYISTSNYVSHNTPYGVGNFYHSTWVDAITGTDINPIRLFWQMHPERDQDWYDKMSSVLGTRRTAQEIDGDFLSSGNTVFDLSDIKAIEECLSEYPATNIRLNGQFREFGTPKKGVEYFMGADIATARATDYSAFTLMDKHGEEWGCFKGKLGVNKFGKLMGDTGKKWNNATLAPETNDVGLAVTAYLQDEGYPNLYYSTKLLRKKGEKKAKTEEVPGWLTTSKNRSLIVDGLEKDIREGNVVIKDPFFPSEAYTFIYDAANRPVAMGKHKRNSAVDVDLEGEVYSDDDIFGKCITNHIRKRPRREVVVLPV